MDMEKIRLKRFLLGEHLQASTEPGEHVSPAPRMETITSFYSRQKSATFSDNMGDHEATGYYEPITMILDRLAFSPKLSARAVAALGGPSRAFSHDLSQ
jgi:hypothetical protein